MSRNDDFFAYNFAFGLEVKQRFPTFHSAIGALHQIRKPSEACVDSDHVNTALLALAAIGRATARPTTHSKNVILIKQNWNSDRASFFSWVALYIREHGRSILKALAGFARPPRELATVGGQEDYMMISQESQEYASRRGVVVLNFCDRENLNILSLECLKICHIDDAVEDPRLRSDPDFVKSLRSRHLSLDETEMQVLAFFPDTTRGGDCAFPLQEVCRLPQLVEDMDSEGDSLGKDLEGDL
ncbi:hypothetical protein Moror_10679 [Moniliophthora roreri MCA 2997]|uniref:Uncharacterized protein n=1 Tax=Moniliophthora roreri (strain MCA 2997) TaxID=1381753 RepID=V2XD93_MONRO|nr:hypothetical protein Moror_10679 [Moniliophthora roreri MCA 2997]